MCRTMTTTAATRSEGLNRVIKEDHMETSTKPERQTAHEPETPDYGHAPIPAAEAPLHDFGDPNLHADHPDHHKAFQDHDFGARA